MNRRSHFFLFLFLTLAAFWPTLRVDFMIDDPFLLGAVIKDPGWSAAAVRSDLLDTVHKQKESLYYRPVLNLFTRLEHSLWGARPFGYHAATLLFHAANATMIVLLLTALGFSQLRSGLVGLFYALNPVLIDDFLSATGGESLATALLLVSLILFLRNKPMLATVASAFAIFSKESNALLPLLAAGLFLYQRRKPAEFKVLIGPVLIAWFYWELRRRIVTAPLDAPDLAQFARFAIVALPRILFDYFARVAAPIHLETWPLLPAPVPWNPLWTVALAAIIGFSVGPARWRRTGLFCVGGFVLLMGPRVWAMMTTHVMMDKWISAATPLLYLPVAALVERGLLSMKQSVRIGVVAALSVVLGSWVTLAHVDVARRGSDEKNYRWTLRNGPRDFANFRLGLILMRSGRAAEAVSVLEPLPDNDDPNYVKAKAMAKAMAAL